MQFVLIISNNHYCEQTSYLMLSFGNNVLMLSVLTNTSFFILDLKKCCICPRIVCFQKFGFKISKTFVTFAFLQFALLAFKNRSSKTISNCLTSIFYWKTNTTLHTEKTHK